MVSKRPNVKYVGTGFVHGLAVAFVLAAIAGGGNKAAAAEHGGEIAIKTPPVLKERLMHQYDLVKVFKNQYPEISINIGRGYRVERKWGVVTKQLAEGDEDVVLAARLDWKHRADEEDRKALRYVPMAKQRVYRIGKIVGGVEYGMLIPREKPSPQAEAFVNFMTAQHVQDILKESDPYHFVPLDTDIKDFEPPEWFGPASWKGPEPEMWHGVCHVGQKHHHTTTIAEIKKAWMQGYNEIQGFLPHGDPGPVYEYCRDRGISVATYASLNGDKEQPESHAERFIKSARNTLDYPELRGGYFENEDHLGRNLVRPLYLNEHRTNKSGDNADAEKVHRIETLTAQFREWLQSKHGDLQQLNKRWETSYDSWNEIGFPELPRDWLSRIDTEIYDGYGNDDTEQLIGRLFHDPIKYTVLEKFPKLLDFWRFSRKVWARRYKSLDSEGWLLNDNVTNYAKKLQPITQKGVIFATKCRPVPYLFREVKEFNAASYDHPACKMPPYFSQVPVDTLQTALGWPVWNSEHHLYNHGASTPKRVRYHILQTYLMGQFKSTSYNRWRTTAAKRRPRHKAAVKSRVQIRRNEDVFRAFLERREDADIAVLVNEGNRGYNTLPEGPNRPDFGGSVKAYGHVGALGKDWKYVLTPDVSAEHCTGTLIVDAPWLLPETVDKINALPSDRRVIVVGEVPAKDEYGQPIPENKLNKLRDRVEVIENWENLHEVVEPADGLTGPYTDVWLANFFWWSPFIEGGRRSYTMPVPKLEIRRVRQEGNLYLAITNHSVENEVTAPIPYAAGHTIRELTSEQSEPYTYGAEETTTFPTQSVNIYEIEGVD